MKLQIPAITDGQLLLVLERLRPVVEQDGALWDIEIPDLRRCAFTWDPKVTHHRPDLIAAITIKTLHSYGAPSFFKPSIADVIAQLPDALADWPGDVSSLVAFSVEGPDSIDPGDADAFNAGYHVAKTTLYRRSEKAI